MKGDICGEILWVTLGSIVSSLCSTNSPVGGPQIVSGLRATWMGVYTPWVFCSHLLHCLCHPSFIPCIIVSMCLWWHNGKVGTSAILFRKGECQAIKSLTYHLGDLTRHSIIEAEITGMLLAAWLIHTTLGSACFSFSIYTDSQTVIRLLTRCFSGSGSMLVSTFCTAANTPLKVNWILGHSKVRGNVKNNDLASLAAQGQLSPAADLPPLLWKPLPFSADAKKQVYNQEIKAMWTEQWQISPRRAHMEQIDKLFPFTSFRTILDSLSHAQSSLLIQLWSGHIPLNAHLFRLNCVDTDKCEACYACWGATSPRETVMHFLFNCPAHQNEWHYLNTALGQCSRDLGYIMSRKDSIWELLCYIGKTKRLRKPFGNVTPRLEENDRT